MKILDLFCGAGGASLGIHRAGHDVHGFDFWPVAVETHNDNGLPATVLDLSVDDPPHPGEPFAMWASPPCQPFSAAGGGAGEFDDRDGFPWLLRIVGNLRPDVVFVENVKGLTFETHRDYFSSVLASLHDLGYEVAWRVLNAADCGVPQTRERCIIVARRDGDRIAWPMPTHTEREGMFTRRWVTMAEALGWGMTGRPFPTIPAREDGGGPRMDGVGGTGARRALYAERDAGDWTLARPATTINGDPRVSAPGHHDPAVSESQQADAIRLTIAELATLQGFPHGWTWCGTKTAQAKQIGNAVPPALAEAIVRANLPAIAERAA